jgi:4-amino-4-deoxy-L-arabinose transferase-like glycosyltransferase
MSLREWLKGHAGLLAVTGLALGLRLLIFIAGQPWTREVLSSRVLFNPSDALGYHHLALKILATGTIDAVGTMRTPGYPAFIAVFYCLFGSMPWLVLLAQVVIGAGTSLIVYFVARRFFDKNVALVSGLLFAADPYCVFYTTTLTTETFFTFLVTSAILLLLLGIDKRRLILVCVAGVAAGCASLVRPIAQYLPLVMVALIVISVRRTLSFRIKACVTVLLCFGIAVTPWILRNGLSHGAFTLSSIGGYNLLLYNVGATEAERSGRKLREVHADLRALAFAAGARPVAEAHEETFENERIYRSVATAYMNEHRRAFAIAYLEGCVKMFLHSSIDDVGRSLSDIIRQSFVAPKAGYSLVRLGPLHRCGVGVVYAYLLITYLAFLFGAFVLLGRREFRALFTFTLVMAYFVILTGHVGASRFKVPMVPFFAPVAAYGLLAAISSRLRARINNDACSGHEDTSRQPAPRRPWEADGTGGRR